MTNSQKSVSVVITTYYRNDSLRNAIESALGQTYPAVEVFVVDDSGEEHARSVANDYDVTYIPHDENKGTNTARNTGIERSDGDYIQLLDDDDRLHREKLRHQMEVFAESNSVGVVYSGVSLEGDRNVREVQPNPAVRGDVLADALTLNLFPCYTSSMLIERDSLNQVMPLAVRPSVDDLWLMIELAQVTEFDYVDQALVIKRQTDSSRGQGMTNVRERFKLIEEFADLYEQMPSPVHGTALGNTYHQMGALLLNSHIWSIRAILAYWKAYYYRPDPPLKFFGACVASVFGRPGINLAKSLVSME